MDDQSFIKQSLPPAIVVMGVSGCGKSTVASALAARLGAVFLEGDRFHPQANIDLMTQGIPLDDENRVEWLERLGGAIAANVFAGQLTVAVCSALKRRYRDQLRRFVPDMAFIFLDIDRKTAQERMVGRSGHFMPASLAESQFAALEPPCNEPGATRIDGTWSAEQIMAGLAVIFPDGR